MVAGSTSPRIGKSNWLATSSRVTGEFAIRKEECVGGGAPLVNQMAKVVEVLEVG